MSRSGRISLKEAERLGILKPAKPRAGTTAKAPDVVGNAARAPAKPRRVAKAPRLPNVVPAVPFDVLFFVPGKPRTKERARTFMPRGQIKVAFERANGNAQAFDATMEGVRHRTFTPGDTVRFERLIGRVAASAMRSRAPYHLPVEMVLAFVFEGDPGTWPTGHDDPDIDNVKKAVLDALKGVVWTDDRLVVRTTSVKACGPVPGVFVKVAAARPVEVDALLREVGLA